MWPLAFRASRSGAGVEDAHGIEGGGDEEGGCDAAVGDEGGVAVEAHLGGLADSDLDTLVSADLCDGVLAVFGTGAFAARVWHHSKGSE